jgi:putative tryptophan/tyrosine transport system substrate-binding protein
MKLHRRRLLQLMGALPAIPATYAQEAPRTLRIGLLSSGDRDVRQSLDAELVRGLKERGYVEGRNLFIERRYSSVRVLENARELAAMKLDAVLATCSPSTHAMRLASASTPIVMASVSDPVTQGLIASLARPGGNVTGTASHAENLLAKRLEIAADLLPRGATLAVVMSGRNPVHALGWPRLEAAAGGLQLKLLKVELKTADDFAAAMEAAVRAKPAGLFVMPDDPMMFNLRPRLIEMAARHRLPDFHWAAEFADAGGLLSYGESLAASYYQTASYMDSIARGVRPGEMPVTQPTRFELVVNLKTARALGLAIPRAHLLRADRVIE